jgi:hypothetical protein
MLDEAVIYVNYEKQDANYPTSMSSPVPSLNHSKSHAIDVKSSLYLVSWMIPKANLKYEEKMLDRAERDLRLHLLEIEDLHLNDGEQLGLRMVQPGKRKH